MRKRLKTALHFINHYETKSKLCEQTEERSLETTKALSVITTQQCINISKSGSLRSTNSFATSIRSSFSVLTVRIWSAVTLYKPSHPPSVSAVPDLLS